MKKLQEINWNFSDFTSAKYPFDLNSIPWYPATFISPIPRVLVASLSKQGDVVLDPFGGKGTTAIETTLQSRIPLYCDLNPFIAESTEGLFAAIEYVLFNDQELADEESQLKTRVLSKEDVRNLIIKYNINPEVYQWFHEDTVRDIVTIVDVIYENEDNRDDRSKLIRKLALSSILKSVSSQQGHFTYVTDNCKPAKEKIKYKNAINIYVEKINQILKAANEFIIQYNLSYKNRELNDILQKRQIVTGNAKDLSWIPDKSVDLVVTSPPYLCSQDYIKTMRLMNLFFVNKQAFEVDVKEEIGARATRSRKSEIVVPGFYADMATVFGNISRVLKDDGFFALVIGQGKSKVTSEYDIISDLINLLKEEFGFKLIFRKERQIGSRVIQVGGVDKESVLIFTR